MIKEAVCVFDIETDGLDVETANMRTFQAYSYVTKESVIFTYKQRDEITKFIKDHTTFIGFNCKAFDVPILERCGFSFEFKMIRDLYILHAPKRVYTDPNKQRLLTFGLQAESYSLDNICKVLKLDVGSKLEGKEVYELLKKDDWTENEWNLIKEYSLQDIVLTKALYEKTEELHKPIIQFLSPEHVRKKIYLNTSAGSLAYHVICDMSGLNVEWSDVEKETTYSGGHHIEPRWEKIRGPLVCMDVVSAYPHAIIQGNLYSLLGEEEECSSWSGNGFYVLNGKYRSESMGVIESSVNKLMKIRIDAKNRGDKLTSQGLKIIINSLYGIGGNPAFKHLYNPITASDCTSIASTWVRKLAKKLQENGYSVVYGFTDSFYVKLDKNGTLEELQMIVDDFLEEAKSHLPFPQETFKIPIEDEFDFIWFVNKQKNVYLKVLKDGKVKATGSLLNVSTPKVVLKIFEEYICPKIARELDVKFTMEELVSELKMELENDLTYAAQIKKVRKPDEYKFQTNLNYQVAVRYGEGKHLLIPNKKMIGVGSDRKYRYCSVEDFIKAGLGVDDIYLETLIKPLEKFTKPYNLEVLE